MLINNRYQVIRPLGEGGFGHAYLAEDTQMPSRRQCVIKQLKPITTNPEIYQLVQDRFQREAAILEQLGENHAQIPRLYAYFSEHQTFYLVQEWIEGITLEALAAQQLPQPEATVRAILHALLPVLHFIHSQGIIHRDIKPENIILRAGSQQPVLIDFGAVRETMGTVLSSHNTPASSIVIGTPGYMSPEQASGRPIPSSDLYSLALTAIYLLTGQAPQTFESDPYSGELIWQAAAAHLSPDLVATLDQAVRSHPRDRFPSAQAFLQALANGTHFPQPVPASPNAGTDASGTAPFHPGDRTPAPTPQPQPPLSQASSQPPAASSFPTMAVAPGALPPNPTPHPSYSPPATTPRQSPKTFAASNRPHPDNPTQQHASHLPGQTQQKSFLTPLTIGLLTALISGSAIAGGLLANRFMAKSRLGSTVNSDIELNNGGDDRAAPEVFSDTDRTDAGDRLEDSENSNTDNANNRAEQPTEPEFSINIVDSGAMEGILVSDSNQINVYDLPSFQAASPHYGIKGNVVTSLRRAYGFEGSGIWHYIRFESGAEGWIPNTSIAAPPTDAEEPTDGAIPEHDIPNPDIPSPDFPAPDIVGPDIRNPDIENIPEEDTLPPDNDGDISSLGFLTGSPSDTINVRSAPSTQAASPHYGVPGDAVTLLGSDIGEDGDLWYNVEFSSGATGWVHGSLIDTP